MEHKKDKTHSIPGHLKAGKEKEDETLTRVVGESVVQGAKKDTVLKEEEILVPVEVKQVREERQALEYYFIEFDYSFSPLKPFKMSSPFLKIYNREVRLVEEIIPLEAPKMEKSRKVLEEKKNTKPATREVLKEENVYAPLEKRKIYEDRWKFEDLRVVEETHPVKHGQIDTAGPVVAQELQHSVLPVTADKAEVKSEHKEHKHKEKDKKERFEGEPALSKVLEDYEVRGIVGKRIRIEEIEITETRRVIEEFVPASNFELVTEDIDRVHSKYPNLEKMSNQEGLRHHHHHHTADKGDSKKHDVKGKLEQVVDKIAGK
jgi:hypothetical protein